MRAALAVEGIEMHMRTGNPPDVNFLAVGDAAIAKIKNTVGKKR